MIRVYSRTKEFQEIPKLEDCAQFINDSIWIDLHNPNSEEIKSVEKAMNICMPTKDEMYGLEISNRLYQDHDKYFMTIYVLVGADTPDPAIEPVTFVISDHKLITLRYVDPQPFRTFISRKEKITMVNMDGKDIMFSLLENISERVADILEKHGHEMDILSKIVFKPDMLVSKVKGNTYEKILKDIGHFGDITAKARESLASILRMVVYLKKNHKFTEDEEEETSIDILESDFKALTEHSKFVAGKINFLLEATLGMISIQQNNIIKIFTVATMMFLPPTLIASVYGMNFTYMPELHMIHGYHLALVLMALSAYVPFKFFKKKGWL